MDDIKTIEADKTLAPLLDLVARGETVAITRDGREVARLVPTAVEDKRAEARAANERIRARAKALGLGKFDWEEWKAYRDEGRR